MSGREWKPGDSHQLPEVDPSCYPPDAVQLRPVNTRLCVLCGNVIDPGQVDFCRYCLEPS